MSLTSVFLSITIALQGPGLAAPQKPAPDKVLAIVNGVPIKASEIEPYLWDWKAAEVTRDLIDAKLIEAEAAKKNVKITDQELDAFTKTRLDAFKATLPKDKTLEDTLKEQGVSMGRVRMGMREQLLVDKILEMDFAPANFINISAITFRIKSAAAADVSAALKRAETAYAQLKKGDSWEKVLRLNETEQNIIDSKGMIGWVTYDQFPKVAADELKNLKAFEFSKPVQTPVGIQIFKVNIQGKAGSANDIAELRSRYIAGQRGQVLVRLRKEAKIEKP